MILKPSYTHPLCKIHKHPDSSTSTIFCYSLVTVYRNFKILIRFITSKTNHHQTGHLLKREPKLILQSHTYIFHLIGIVNISVSSSILTSDYRGHNLYGP